MQYFDVMVVLNSNLSLPYVRDRLPSWLPHHLEHLKIHVVFQSYSLNKFVFTTILTGVLSESAKENSLCLHQLDAVLVNSLISSNNKRLITTTLAFQENMALSNIEISPSFPKFDVLYSLPYFAHGDCLKYFLGLPIAEFVIVKLHQHCEHIIKASDNTSWIV